MRLSVGGGDIIFIISIFRKFLIPTAVASHQNTPYLQTFPTTITVDDEGTRSLSTVIHVWGVACD